jgi:hypothetical protein
MSKKLGLFINNTDSEIKIKTNFNNFEMLKKNFDVVIIIDNKNIFSLKLKNELTLNNTIKNYYIINRELENNKIDKILYVLERLNINDLYKIFFIDDSYIYCNDLNEYFEYDNKHNHDLCVYLDSNESKYSYELFLYSIKYSEIDKYKKLLIDEKDKKLGSIETDKNINYKINEIFEKNLVFLKIAYILENKNIFIDNINFYRTLVNNNSLPILNIESLNKFKLNYKFNIRTEIPKDFDINTYKKYDDIKDFNNERLFDHFLNDGQFETRIYNKNEDNNISILPGFIRNQLKNCNLLYLFDIPDNFSLYKYKENYDDLKNLNEEKLILHWMDYGCKEDRNYS